MADPVYTPPSGPPQGSPPRLFEHIGLEPLQAFSRDMYQRLSRSEISALFPSDPGELEAASRRQADFLTGAFGGPQLYRQKYGHPRMRARHLPFPIDEHARQTWLSCFQGALGDGSRLNLDAAQTEELLRWIERFSEWMMNRK